MLTRKLVIGAGGAGAVAALIAIFVIAPRLGTHHAARSHRAHISVEGAYFTLGPGETPATPFQLDKTAPAIAVVTPSATTRVETGGGHPVTLTTVTVAETVKGALPGTIILRQRGTAGDAHSSVVSPGHTYLAYVTPYEPRVGHPVPGQYVVIANDQGVLEQDTYATTRTSSGGSSQTFESLLNSVGAEAFSVTITLDSR